MHDQNHVDNEYLDLPDDAEVAFATIHRRKFKELEVTWENGGGEGYYYERQYVDTLVAFDEVYNLGILTTFHYPPISNSEFYDFFQDFRRHCEIASQKILMESARRMKTGAENIVVLDAAARQAIHQLINSIRDRLNDISIPENKRESLFNKLNAFAAEIDRNRTRAESFYSFAIDTARLGRELNDEIKPLQQTIDRVFDWIEKASKWKDALPPWGERKKIDGPPKRLPKPDFGKDDDIPF